MQRNPYWPLKGPPFFGSENPSLLFFLAARKAASASGQISRCGWQADDRTFISETHFNPDDGGSNHNHLDFVDKCWVRRPAPVVYVVDSSSSVLHAES